MCNRRLQYKIIHKMRIPNSDLCNSIVSKGLNVWLLNSTFLPKNQSQIFEKYFSVFVCLTTDIFLTLQSQNGLTLRKSLILLKFRI